MRTARLVTIAMAVVLTVAFSSTALAQESWTLVEGEAGNPGDGFYDSIPRWSLDMDADHVSWYSDYRFTLYLGDVQFVFYQQSEWVSEGRDERYRPRGYYKNYYKLEKPHVYGEEGQWSWDAARVSDSLYFDILTIHGYACSQQHDYRISEEEQQRYENALERVKAALRSDLAAAGVAWEEDVELRRLPDGVAAEP